MSIRISFAHYEVKMASKSSYFITKKLPMSKIKPNKVIYLVAKKIITLSGHFQQVVGG